MRIAAPALLIGACLVGGRASAEQAKTAKPTKTAKMQMEPKAQRVLHEMSDFMSRQKAFEVEVAGTTDALLGNGQKVQFNRNGRVSIKRPNKLRVDRKGDLVDAQIFYDGKTLTVYARNSNRYAQRPAPPTIEATVSELYDKFDMDLGPGDLLSEHPEKTLTEDALSGKFLGTSTIDGVNTNHIAVRGNEVDWELWVEDGARPLPRKYVITSKTMEQSPQYAVPQYAVTLSNWKLVADLPDDTFTFNPPKDAQKIDFVDQVKAKKPKGKKE